MVIVDLNRVSPTVFAFRFIRSRLVRFSHNLTKLNPEEFGLYCFRRFWFLILLIITGFGFRFNFGLSLKKKLSYFLLFLVKSVIFISLVILDNLVIF